MILKFQKLLNSKIAALSEQQKIKLIEDCLIVIFNTKKDATTAVNELNGINNTEEEKRFLNKTFNIDLLNLIFSHLQSDNLTGLISGMNDINKLGKDFVSTIDINNINELPEKSALIGELYIKTLFGITDKEITKDTLEDIIAKEIYYTKTEIAEEFGVDKKTFNKWLKVVSGDKYAGRKKLSFSEYKDIFELLFLAKDESKLDIDKKFELYFKRLKHKTVQKSDLVELTSSDYKTLKANAEKVTPAYSELNVLPFSISEIILEKMNGKAR